MLQFSVFSFRSLIIFFLLLTTIIGHSMHCIRVHSTRSTNFVYERFYAGMGNDSNIQHSAHCVNCIYSRNNGHRRTCIRPWWQNTKLKSKLVNTVSFQRSLGDFVNSVFDVLFVIFIWCNFSEIIIAVSVQRFLLMRIHTFDDIEWTHFNLVFISKVSHTVQSKFHFFNRKNEWLRILFMKFYLWSEITLKWSYLYQSNVKYPRISSFIHLGGMYSGQKSCEYVECYSVFIFDWHFLWYSPTAYRWLWTFAWFLIRPIYVYLHVRSTQSLYAMNVRWAREFFAWYTTFAYHSFNSSIEFTWHPHTTSENNIWNLTDFGIAHSCEIAQHFFIHSRINFNTFFNSNVGFISLRQFEWFCFEFIVHPNRSIFSLMESLRFCVVFLFAFPIGLCE